MAMENLTEQFSEQSDVCTSAVLCARCGMVAPLHVMPLLSLSCRNGDTQVSVPTCSCVVVWYCMYLPRARVP